MLLVSGGNQWINNNNKIQTEVELLIHRDQILTFYLFFVVKKSFIFTRNEHYSKHYFGIRSTKLLTKLTDFSKLQF